MSKDYKTKQIIILKYNLIKEKTYKQRIFITILSIKIMKTQQMNRLVQLLNRKLLEKSKQNQAILLAQKIVSSFQKDSTILNNLKTLKFQQEQVESMNNFDKIKNQNLTKKGNKRVKLRGVITFEVIELIRNKFRQYAIQQQNSFIKNKNKLITLRSVADDAKLSLATIQNLYKQYKNDPLFTIRYQKMSKNDKTTQYGEEKRRLNSARAKFIQKLLQSNPSLTKHQIAELMSQNPFLRKRTSNEQNKKISISTIQKLQNMSERKEKKNIANRNSPENIQKRYQYCQAYKKMLSQGGQSYFIGLTNFNLFNTKNSVYLNHHQRGNLDTHTTSVDLIGIVAHNMACHCQIIKNDSNRKTNIVKIFQQSLKQISQLNSAPKYLIMEKSFLIQENLQIEKIIRQYNFFVIQLPPFSNLLNPLDYLFHDLKVNIKKKFYQTEQTLIQQILNKLKIYKNLNIKFYFESSKMYFEESLKRSIIN